ncbi:MAG: YybH family protein [Mycobacterium sp.]
MSVKVHSTGRGTMEKQTNGDQVRAVLDRWLAAFNAKDSQTLFSLYDPDTVYANSGSGRMDGVEGLRPWYEEVFEDRSLRVLFKEETLFEDDALALIAGKFHFRNLQADGSYQSGGCGRVALLFRRAKDGAWRLAYDIDNKAPDVFPTDFE